MSFSLSGGAPLRIAAIVGGFVLLGGGYFLVGPGKPKTATTEHHLVQHPNGLQSFGKTAAKTKATGGKASAKTATTATKHEAAPTKAKPVAKPKPKPVHVALVGGLPDELAAALQQHRVVVAALYNPDANDDQIAVAEASAGAALSGAGFVALSVLDQDQIGGVTRVVGVVDSPAVLIYQRPGQVIGQLHGFADKELIAQAVTNAAPELATAPPRSAPAAVHAAAPTSTSASTYPAGVDAGEVIAHAIPAIEKYEADHSGYVGMTYAKLRESDPGIGKIVIIGLPTATSYCISATAGKKTFYKRGPGGKITTTPCKGP